MLTMGAYDEWWPWLQGCQAVGTDLRLVRALADGHPDGTSGVLYLWRNRGFTWTTCDAIG